MEVSCSSQLYPNRFILKDRHNFQIRQTATAVLGAALSDLIPQGYLLKGGGTGSIFYYDIVMGETLAEVMLPHLENRMREIVSKDHPVKIHEMVPSNALEFFRHNRRYYPAHFVQQSQDPLVQVVQIDAFIDLVEGEFLEKTGELGPFKLIKIEERLPLRFRKQEKLVYRVIGQHAAGEKSPVDPFKVGEELALFDVSITRGADFLEKNNLCWRKRGEALFFHLYEKWRKVHLKEEFELVVGGALSTGRSAEFFLSKDCHSDLVTTVCLEKDLLPSLQKCIKIIEELSLVEGKWGGSAPETFQETFRALNLEWKKGKEMKIERKGSFLTVRKNKEFYTIEHSVFPCMQQMVLHVLEDSEKDLSQKKELLSIVAVCDE